MYYLNIFHDFYTADFKNKITIAVTSHGACVCTRHHTCVPGGKQWSNKNKFFLITKLSSSISLHSSARLQIIMPKTSDFLSI